MPSKLNSTQYIDCSVQIITTGKYVRNISVLYTDDNIRMCYFPKCMFTDDNLISLLKQLQSDNNVAEYNVIYW